MKNIWKRIITGTAATVLIASALACGTPSNEPSIELEPQRTVTALEQPPPTGESSPGNTTARNQGATQQNGTNALLPTPKPITKGATEPRPTAATKPADSVVVAPRVETPTSTPIPEPSPTTPADGEPEVRWTKFGTADYEALLPDPNGGLSWGQDLKNCDEGPTINVTPAGTLDKYPDWYARISPGLEIEADPGEALEEATGYESRGAIRKIPGTQISIDRACTQWTMVHPEIPLMAVIYEAVVWAPTQKTDGQKEVWRTGAHYIIKDEYTQAGTSWKHSWTLEKIGPTIVEQATCETMMMPRFRNPDGTGAC